MTETVFLVAFFKFEERGPGWGFERVDLQFIFKTEEEAVEEMCFCDEAGWYEGVLIEERSLGCRPMFRGKRRWFIQKEAELVEIEEPSFYKNVVNFIG